MDSEKTFSGRGRAIPPRPSPLEPARSLRVTTSVVLFAIRDWALWVLLRNGPWGPPMRVVSGRESLQASVERTLEALLLWPLQASLIDIKAGWLEQDVHVWGSSEQGGAVSLIYALLLRANRDELLPDLHLQRVPSLQVNWTPVTEIETGQRGLDASVGPVIDLALKALRMQVQQEPDIVLRYLADMGGAPTTERLLQTELFPTRNRETRRLDLLKEPLSGNGYLTLAEAALLYRAFFPGEILDLSNIRRRLLATDQLEPVEEERPVRGKEADWRRVSKVYYYRT